MRVLMAGGEAAGARAFQLLAASAQQVVAVAAAPESALATRASAAGVEVVAPDVVADPGFASWVDDNGIDVLINVHALHLVAPEVLAALIVGGFNLHPGPLPSYAGVNAPSWAIVNGEARHAVTLHRMDAGIDTGSIVAEAWFDLGAGDTGLSVATRCARLGLDLLRDLLGRLDAGVEPPTIHNSGPRHLYRAADRPYDGRLPVDEPAIVVDRVVRACTYHPLPSPLGWPEVSWSGRTVGIVAGAPVAGDGPSVGPGRVVAVTSDGGALMTTGAGRYRIDRVIDGESIVAAGQVLVEGDQLA